MLMIVKCHFICKTSVEFAVHALSFDVCLTLDAFSIRSTVCGFSYYHYYTISSTMRTHCYSYRVHVESGVAKN